MISRPVPYSPFRKTGNRCTSCNEKDHWKNIPLINTFCQPGIGCGRIGIAALRLAVVMLSIVWSLPSAIAGERFDHALGHFEAQSAGQGIIIGAPHGTYDMRTDVLAKEAARMLGAGYVIARGFSSGAWRVNVNRPTEGAGRTCERERRTGRAQDVYDHYARLIGKSCNGQALRLYVEIHGHSSLPFSNRLEIATTGITHEEARQLKERFAAFLSQAKAVYPSYPDLELRIEPLDKIFFGAGCNKKIGYLSTRPTSRALHMEIPRLARTPEALGATAALVSSIVRAAMHLDEPDFGPGKKETSKAKTDQTKG